MALCPTWESNIIFFTAEERSGCVHAYRHVRVVQAHAVHGHAAPAHSAPHTRLRHACPSHALCFFYVRMTATCKLLLQGFRFLTAACQINC
jgi:hypothetical protein